MFVLFLSVHLENIRDCKIVYAPLFHRNFKKMLKIFRGYFYVISLSQDRIECRTVSMFQILCQAYTNVHIYFTMKHFDNKNVQQYSYF